MLQTIIANTHVSLQTLNWSKIYNFANFGNQKAKLFECNHQAPLTSKRWWGHKLCTTFSIYYIYTCSYLNNSNLLKMLINKKKCNYVKVYWPFSWQRSPFQSGLQMHMNSSSVLIHTPSCSHGSLPHGLAVKLNKKNVLACFNVYSN